MVSNARAMLGAMLLIFAVTGVAGPRYDPPGVSILVFPTGGGIASGTLGGTRNSGNTIERISCSVTRSETNSAGVVRRSTLVSCAARDVAATTISCTTRSNELASALGGVSNDSLLELRFDANGQCTDIAVYESTSLERKR